MKTIVGTDIQEAISLLNAGETVAVPTETVYGLAANGLNEIAIHKIFEAKGRPLSNPLILHFANEEAVLPFVSDFPEALKKLAAKFWPGPLTFLLPKTELVPKIITAGQEKVAVRVPNHPILRELLSKLDFPLAAPSANSYGMISPTQAAHVYKQLKGKISYILDGGCSANGLESTIVGMEVEKVIVYRLGSISIEDLADVLGYQPTLNNQSDDKPLTSGMVKHHYAPSTPFSFIEVPITFNLADNFGYIFLKDSNTEIPSTHKYILSETGNLEEAAKNLYSAMHEMDQRGFNKMFVERFANDGLGLSMNDRLNRATMKFEK
jgi:L-threonylcarbamoyladenylate synthase